MGGISTGAVDRFVMLRINIPSHSFPASSIQSAAPVPPGCAQPDEDGREEECTPAGGKLNGGAAGRLMLLMEAS